MFCNFQEIFHPTPEQKRKQEENLKKLKQQAFYEKWCCTCKHFIPVDDRLPGFITAYPECKLNGLAIETCDYYEIKEE